MKVVIKNVGIKSLFYGMILTGLFWFPGVEPSDEVYTNVSEVRVRDENFVSRTLTGKELKKKEKQKKGEGS